MKNKNKISKMAALFVGLACFTQASMAQNNVLRSVGASLQYAQEDMSYLVEAYNDIQKAYRHERTSNSPRMWLYRSMVYSRVWYKRSNGKFASEDLTSAGLTSGVSMQKFYEHPGPKKDDDIYEASLEVGNSFATLYNESNSLLQRGNDSLISYDSLVMYMELGSYLFDKLDTSAVRKFSNNGINKSSVTERLMYFVAKSDNIESKKRIFGESIKSGELNAMAYEGLALVYLGEGDTSKAESMLMNAYKSNPQEKEMFNVLKNFYISSNQTNKLLDVVEGMIKIDSTNSSYFYLRGKLRDDVLKEHSLARRDYKKAIELDEFNYDAYFDLGANIVSYETMKWRNMKVNARTEADRNKADEGLLNVYRMAEEYLLIATENTEYGVNDKRNLYQALYVVYSELDNPGKAQYYRSMKEYLEN